GVAAWVRRERVGRPGAAIRLFLRSDGTRPYSFDMTSAARTVGDPGRPLLAGAITIEGRWPAFLFTNSAILYDAGGTQVGRYDKTQLVPIVEAMPFPRLLGWVTWLANTAVVSRWPTAYAPL